MSDITELTAVLKASLGWNLARVKCLSLIMTCLIKVQSVNLRKLASAFPGATLMDSNYKRLQRLFRSYNLNFTQVARLIVAMLPYTKLTLSLDRTNWKLGTTNINFLVLGVVHKGVAFPILWMLLPKRGNSSTAERIALMERYADIFGLTTIECLLADREFIGDDWLSYLKENKVSFRIRIRSNMLVSRAQGGTSAAKSFFRNLTMGQSRELGLRTVGSHKLCVHGAKLETGKYLIIVSSGNNSTVLDDYKKDGKLKHYFRA
ncbi:MAG: IS4/IS5 family transposase [Gammaproteobacteria bacterium]|nr:IS4/IS5 family transposase [Gammaproteobacteria bacterium]